MSSPTATAMASEPSPESRTAFLMGPMASPPRLRGLDISTQPRGLSGGPTGTVVEMNCRGGAIISCVSRTEADRSRTRSPGPTG